MGAPQSVGASPERAFQKRKQKQETPGHTTKSGHDKDPDECRWGGSSLAAPDK